MGGVDASAAAREEVVQGVHAAHQDALRGQRHVFREIEDPGDLRPVVRHELGVVAGDGPQPAVDGPLVLLQRRFEHLVVNLAGPVEGVGLQPQQQRELAMVVQGEGRGHPLRRAFQQREAAEDAPVVQHRHLLRVLSQQRPPRLQRLVRPVHRVRRPAQQARGPRVLGRRRRLQQAAQPHLPQA
eukprot:CAMPEP_0119130354 /NCGR_PEP_ID=MMETSP1310-20130426/7730_1 /TAXON_ID=464262 /ORGANISM="Genus nov. species nov., Strain RCC2339" /LENGTH=183 /DNA_ID=CAMNT_0007120855 /DNA_START=250 /DNA_END=798 /DNA_ORIENTATION=-